MKGEKLLILKQCSYFEYFGFTGILSRTEVWETGYMDFDEPVR